MFCLSSRGVVKIGLVEMFVAKSFARNLPVSDMCVKQWRHTVDFAGVK